MNISPHLLIDAVILSAALTITLILRAKGNAPKKKKKGVNDCKKKRKFSHIENKAILLEYLYPMNFKLKGG